MGTLFTLVVVLLFSFLFAIGNEFALRDASNVSSLCFTCRTSVIMTLWPTRISIFDITTKYPNPADPRRLLICNLFSWNTSHSHDNLRRVSKSPLLHPFTRRRSGALDWRVTRATSADSRILIHTILAHSSTLHYLSIFCCHRTLNSSSFL
jgi:hypothetical protein